MKRSANYIISFAASYQTHIARSAKKKTACALQLRYFGAQRLGRWLKTNFFKQKLVKIPPP
jgi:hypothetical protein